MDNLDTASSAIYGPGTQAWTIVNQGRVASTGQLGIDLRKGGLVANTGTISGVETSVFIGGAEGTVINSGLISAGGGFGVWLGSGMVVNLGTIAGKVGVRIDGTNETMGIETVINGGTNAVAASITGSQYGVRNFGPGGVVNHGTIASTGGTALHFGKGGIALNRQSGLIAGGITGINFQTINGTVSNAGTITAGRGSGVSGASVVNGNSTSHAARISGNISGIENSNSLVNYGTVFGVMNGFVSRVGPSGVTTNVTNEDGALIFGATYGVRVASTAGVVSNFGTIVGGSGVGINFDNVYSRAGSTVTNAGTIIGSQDLAFGGSYADVLTNSGRIDGTSGTAVLFRGGDDLLALQPGYSFFGLVDGGIGSDTLELLGSAIAPLTVDYNALGMINFEKVLFGTGDHSTLKVSNTSGTLGVVISGFSSGSEFVDLTGIGANGTISYSNTLTDRITVTGSFGGVTLQFGSIDGLSFTTVTDGSGGTDLSIACFLRGTGITTPDGEVAIESLTIGDRVLTASGETRPIRWIGRRAYDGRFVAGNKAILPIRIGVGALADGVPARDLWLSPEHSLYFDGVLAQAAHLVNGLTIEQAEAVERVEYFHIELDSHDILIADGAPAESYIDCDNRLMFENGAEFAAVYPNDDRARWQFSLPRLEPGSAELTEIRAALLARAEQLGFRLDADPDLHLFVEGAVMRPELVDDCVYRFTVPAGGTGVRLASRSTVPAEITAGVGDVRRLGVAIACLRLYDANLCIEAGHSHAALDDGFHPDEETHRWTDGLAQIPTAWLRCFAGAFTLEVRLASRDLVYPVPLGGERVAAA